MEKVAEISITNIKGIESLEFKPKTINIISGANGTGKSSILDALRNVFEGGHNPDLIRRGAKFGEVVLVLTDGITIRHTIKPDKSERVIKSPDGTVVKRPAEYIEKLARSFAFDPMAFIGDKVKPKDRLDYLQKALNLTFTRAEVSQAAEGAAVDKETLTLDDLAAFRKGRYDERRDANVKAKQLESTITTLTKSLPETDEADSIKQAEQKQRKIQEIKTILDDELRGIDADAMTQERRLHAELAEKIDTLRREYAQLIMDAGNAAIAKKEDCRAEARPIIDGLTADLATLTERAYAAKRAEGTRGTIKQMQEDAGKLNRQSMQLDRILEGLDHLRKKKLENLPIEGLDVRDGRIYYNDIPFESLNTATRIKLAFQLGSMDVGELGLMIADGAESLDEASLGELKSALEDAGMQAVFAEVNREAGSPLEVSAA